MTIPAERRRSLIQAREFLLSLLDPKMTPRIPREVRKNAYWALRHFPHAFEIERLAEACPELLGDGLFPKKRKPRK